VRTGRIFASAVAALALSSCGIVDDFSDRAVRFNVVAEQAQQQALLLNIVRASLNRPMQFTTLSSITGQASETGGTTLSVPFGEATHRPRGAVSPDVFGLSGSISGGPTFTVPVLDTQEFYQGELKPLTGQEYRFFLDEGITPSVLFYMFVDTIELKAVSGTQSQIFTFHSYVADDFDNDRYETVADYLLALGLSIEQMNHSQTIGPPIPSAQLYDLRDIAQLTSAGLHLTAVHGGPKPAATYKPATSALKPVAKLEKKPAEGKGPTLYQIEKSSVVDRPCFNPLPGATARAVIDPTLLCGSNEPADAAEQQVNTLTRTGGFVAPDLAAGLEKVRADYVAALEQKNQTAIAAQMRALPAIPPDATLQVRLYMRSPEAILHFLGSVVARELYPGSSAPRVIRVKIGEPYLPYPAARCPATNDPNAPGDVSPGFRCDNLFVLLQGQSTDSALSVDYDGRSYSVPASDRVAGRTMRMLDLIKQIMALHTSAKDLPASNVLNIIGGAAP
jgi:hypothetical protein